MSHNTTSAAPAAIPVPPHEIIDIIDDLDAAWARIRALDMATNALTDRDQANALQALVNDIGECFHLAKDRLDGLRAKGGRP